MIQIAHDRILHLFTLAEIESQRAPGPWADRYVQLARRIGTRYNVRVPRALSERFCRGCSTYWVEGRTVRTRLRAGRRTRSCLVCGRVQRRHWKDTRGSASALPETGPLERNHPGLTAAEVEFDGGEEDDDGGDGE